MVHDEHVAIVSTIFQLMPRACALLATLLCELWEELLLGTGIPCSGSRSSSSISLSLRLLFADLKPHALLQARRLEEERRAAEEAELARIEEEERRKAEEKERKKAAAKAKKEELKRQGKLLTGGCLVWSPLECCIRKYWECWPALT